MVVCYQPKVRFDKGYDGSIKAVLGYDGSMHTLKTPALKHTHSIGQSKRGSHTPPKKQSIRFL